MLNNFIPLILFSLSSALTPGPNNFMVMNSGLHFGIKRSIPHCVGICLGFPLMVLLVALGLGAVFVKYYWIKTILKIVGSIYMIYLAWLIVTSHSKADTISTQKPLTFLQAALFQWVNPKAWIMAVSTISIFTITENYYMNAIIISIVFLITCIPSIGAWLLFGNMLQRIIKNDRQRVWFNILMALGIVGSIVMIIFD